MCNISFVVQTIPTKLGICVYNHICNKMASANSQLPKIVLVNSTEGTLVAKSISWNVRKVSIGCDQRVHLWQLNNEYTTQTVFYLLIPFRHLFIILICIFNHYNLIHFFVLVVCSYCFMQTDCWRCISTISINYIQWKPYYAYLSNVASGLDAYSSSYIVGDISATILIW